MLNIICLFHVLEGNNLVFADINDARCMITVPTISDPLSPTVCVLFDKEFITVCAK